MKKVLILKCDLEKTESSKIARELRKAHEKLFGKGTCSVVVLPTTAEVVTLCEDWDDLLGAATDDKAGCNSTVCDVVDCPKKTV